MRFRHKSIHKTSPYQKLLDLHHDYYLTLISVIQGIVFAIFIFDVRETWSNLHSLSVGLNLATMVVVMILAWKEYIIGTTSFSWIPRLPDTILPFLLGVAQCYGCYQVQNTHRFLLALSITGFISFLAYINMYYNASRFEMNIPLLQKTRTFSKINLSSTVVVSVTYFLCFLFYKPEYQTLYSVLIFAIILVYMLRSYLYWETIIQWMAGEEGDELRIRN